MIHHFLSLTSFSTSQILSLLERANSFSLKYQHQSFLTNRIFANVFYEPSTRTRCSFEIAAKRLGAEIVNFTPDHSSVKKGETVYDTLKSLESLGVDGIILRHSDDHIFEQLRSHFDLPLINAGAGINEHPSQGLLDLLTLYQEFKKLEGLKIAVCGDIKHSRVAGSLMMASEKFNMKLFLCGPDFLLPTQSLGSNIVKSSLDEVIDEVDAVMMLRIQLERHFDIELDEKTYLKKFGLHENRAKKLKPHAIILHPGPFNRDVEISSSLIEHSKSRIFKQMSNGVLVRMAILEWVLKGFYEKN